MVQLKTRLKLRYNALKTRKKSSVEDNPTDTSLVVEAFQLYDPSVAKKPFNINVWKEKTNFNSLETIYGLAEKYLFQQRNYIKIKINITTEERITLKKIEHNEFRSCCV